VQSEAESPSKDENLVAIVMAWPRLPDSMKAAIRAMVEAAARNKA
jgi:hypothetical protein